MAMPKLEAPLLFFFFFFFVFVFLLAPTPSRAETFGPPLVSPVQKDPSTLQYIITAYLRSPEEPTKLFLDLGGSYFWINCDDYNSSTYRHIPCTTLLDEFVGCFACLMNCRDSTPNCGDSVCVLKPENPFDPTSSDNSNQYAPALVDYFSMLTLDNTGSIGGLSSSSPFTFIFSCAYKENLRGLAGGVTGSAGLGRSRISIPVQASTIFHYPRYFALCLSGSKTRPGAAFIGTKGPYKFGRGIDLSKSLVYTPLLLNPVGKYSYPDLKKPSDEYFIGVSSIKVHGKVVALNRSLLAIDSGNGSGGTKLSTVVPFTQLATSIYKAVTEAFVKAAASSPFNLTAAKPAQPFSVCYPARNVKTTRDGPTVPAIELVMHRNDVVWKILGSNSMVRVAMKGGDDVLCLGFVDAGVKPRTSIFAGDPSIVIGGYQMEDNFLQFDLESMRLGFSSSVLSRGTNCASFKFAAKRG
ncbi:hypothetical protein OIU85_004627 [Salix viminalis]|uniref:Peptidase A1 domain-containing protein n=1 Tax=Salix viminalis TaxID=40686 RepID=A0A9Q0SXM9_SALVM|nr:hypothetical protein OIU85_004627 [Salix viminalis]